MEKKPLTKLTKCVCVCMKLCVCVGGGVGSGDWRSMGLPLFSWSEIALRLIQQQMLRLFCCVLGGSLLETCVSLSGTADICTQPLLVHC